MKQATTVRVQDDILTESRTNPVLVSQQIEGLREVIRRLRVSKVMTVDSLTNEKLEAVKKQYAM